ncbi:tyrosine-type recombinase/integrase [Aurantimonas sp. NFXS3]|uniref:tyrosine-type recombinase/integrase n=1 Tax=Aurantimonas sp. NFXS3 TaxID=2818434 RepID=UPI003BA39F1E
MGYGPVYRDERLQTVSPATALREIAIRSHVLEVAMRDWGMRLARNPAKAIRRPQVSDARERLLQDDEEARLLAACNIGWIACMKALLIVAGGSGMRRGELLGLRWSELAPERGGASLDLTKNGSARQVPLMFSPTTAGADPQQVYPTKFRRRIDTGWA